MNTVHQHPSHTNSDPAGTPGSSSRIGDPRPLSSVTARTPLPAFLAVVLTLSLFTFGCSSEDPGASGEGTSTSQTDTDDHSGHDHGDGEDHSGHDHSTDESADVGGHAPAGYVPGS